MTDNSNIVKHPAVETDNSELRDVPRGEANSPVRPQSDVSGAASTEKSGSQKRTQRRRRILFSLLPLALLVGGYFYVTGGRYMSTDNAYVQTDILGVSTDVSGLIASIDVHENEEVEAGQTLFTLKSEPFRIALEGAQAELGQVRNQIMGLKATYKHALVEIAQAQADIPYYEATYERQKNLVATRTASQSALDQAKHDLDAAHQKVSVAQAQAESALAQLGGDADQPIEQNPLFMQAKAKLDDAQRQLDDSVVRAPFAGIVTNVSALQVGSYLQASEQAFSLVASDHVWIDANPKETELTYIKPGQKVTISIDTYPGIEWEGEVASISPASGASFALLPSQNTSGNWVKVVQRIPMRVSVKNPAGKPPLRAGMSADIEIDTGHSRGLPSFLTNLFGRSDDV